MNSTERRAPFEAAALRIPPGAPGPAPDQLAAYLAHYGLPPADAQGYMFQRLPTPVGAVAVQRYVPDGACGTVIALHGLFDHGGLWRHYVHWALARRCAVVLVDLPGHGLSDGPRARVEDFAEYRAALLAVLEAVGPELPGPWFGLGHSTGAAVLMDVVHGAGVDLDDLWLLAPLVRAAAHRAGGWLLPLVGLVRRELPRGDYGNTLDPDFNAFRNADPLQPPVLPLAWLRAARAWSDDFLDRGRSPASPLVVQGEGDRTVAWRENVEHLAALFTEPRIELLPGVGHNLMNERSDHRAAVLGLLAERLAQASSGAGRARWL